MKMEDAKPEGLKRSEGVFSSHCVKVNLDMNSRTGLYAKVTLRIIPTDPAS